MMGRNRRLVASMAASVMDMPAAVQVAGELHDEDGVLARQGDHEHQPDLRVKVIVVAPEDAGPEGRRPGPWALPG